MRRHGGRRWRRRLRKRNKREGHMRTEGLVDLRAALAWTERLYAEKLRDTA